VASLGSCKAEGWRGGEVSGACSDGGPQRQDPAAGTCPSPERARLETDYGIKGFLETSFLDWPGRLAAVLFLGGCNFRCPFCHNAELVLAPHAIPSVPLGAVLDRLRALRGWVDGVVVSGGEPTCSPRLAELLGRLKAAGYAVKLDTNGSRPEVLARLLARGLVAAVDMDVKGPFEAAAYARMAGVPVRVEEVRASVEILRAAGLPHRFRTTYVPGLLGHGDLARLRAGLPAGSPLVLQAFSPRRVLDPALAAVAPPPPEEMLALDRLCAGAAPLGCVAAAC
jgi:pyruvate formate lyase activating enzyme